MPSELPQGFLDRAAPGSCPFSSKRRAVLRAGPLLKERVCTQGWGEGEIGERRRLAPTRARCQRWDWRFAGALERREQRHGQRSRESKPPKARTLRREPGFISQREIGSQFYPVLGSHPKACFITPVCSAGKVSSPYLRPDRGKELGWRPSPALFWQAQQSPAAPTHKQDFHGRDGSRSRERASLLRWGHEHGSGCLLPALQSFLLRTPRAAKRRGPSPCSAIPFCGVLGSLRGTGSPGVGPSGDWDLLPRRGPGMLRARSAASQTLQLPPRRGPGSPSRAARRQTRAAAAAGSALSPG